ncbi:hypothetical protein DFH09DRAFT_1308761 [Mycena vulgaris]|nr:hypothetical protein DFH09DRAFT_1308761 [Mycena vulgaris]
MSPDGVKCTTLSIGAGPKEPVSECILLPGCNDALLNLPGFPQPLIYPATPAFRIAATPDKETAFFSTRALKMGDLILSERALFAAARVTYTADVEKYFQLSVSRMRPAAKSAFMALASSPKEDGSGPSSGLCLKDETYRAICKVILRLGHSTSSNTASHFDLRSFSYRLFALRDIAAGKELTYTDTYLCPAPEPEGKPTFDYGMMSIAPVFREPCEKTLLQLSRVDLARENLLTNEEFRLQIEGVYTLMESYICLGDAQGASKWTAKLDKCFKGNEMGTEALVDPASAAYPKHSLWRHRVERELAKGMPQPVLVNSAILFPIESRH